MHICVMDLPISSIRIYTVAPIQHMILYFFRPLYKAMDGKGLIIDVHLCYHLKSEHTWRDTHVQYMYSPGYRLDVLLVSNGPLSIADLFLSLAQPMGVCQSLLLSLLRGGPTGGTRGEGLVWV